MTQGPEIAGLLKFLDKLEGEAKSCRTRVAGDDKWDTYLDISRGKGWQDKSKNPLFQANFIGNGIERKAALLTENKPELKVSPRRAGLSKTALKLGDTISAGWDEYNIALALESLSHYVQIFGAGGFKIGYDPKADFGRGDMVIGAVDPRNLKIDPAITYSYDTDRAQYMIEESVQSLWDLQDRFPGVGGLVKPDSRVSMFQGASSEVGFVGRMQRIFRSGGGQADGAVPRAYVRDYWFKDPAIDAKNDGARLFPFGRHVIRANNDIILHDVANPYFDGGWPLMLLDGRMDLDHPWGQSEVGALRRIQEAANRIGHMFVENAILSGNTWVLGDTDALSNDAVQKLSNLGAIYIEKRFGRDLQRQPPPPMPPHMLGFVDTAMTLIDFLLGLQEGGATAKGRMEIRSGSMLEGLQSAAQTLVRSQARRLEGFLERLGQKWIARIFQFYTDSRLMTFVGHSGDFDEFTFERDELMQELASEATATVTKRAQGERRPVGIDETKDEILNVARAAWKDFRFKVKPGSSLAATRMQRVQVFAELAKNHIGSVTRVLREVGIDNPEEELQQAFKEAQMFAALSPPGQGGKKTG